MIVSELKLKHKVTVDVIHFSIFIKCLFFPQMTMSVVVMSALAWEMLSVSTTQAAIPVVVLMATGYGLMAEGVKVQTWTCQNCFIVIPSQNLYRV